MIIQDNNINETKVLIKPTTFRTIHYLGSKLRVLNFIKDVIDEIDPKKNGVCDLFSGTGSVSNFLSNERKIISVDIQSYSYNICSALLNPLFDEFIEAFPERIINSKNLETYSDVFLPLLQLEENLVNGEMSSNLELVCNFLENASLYSAILGESNEALPELKEAMNSTISNLNAFNEKSFLASKYLGGVYFSFKQSISLDAILTEINNSPSKYRKILLAALLSTASDIVNTVGKQFAQPIRPRNKNGTPKKGIIKQIRKDRNLDVVSIYIQWLKKYSNNTPTNKGHKILKIDFREALKILDDDVKVIYADPPYTRDHYSRFYHGLETLCLMDYPRISKTRIGGTEKLSRGLYREGREQSDFCIKSKAPKAFEELFKLVSKKNKTLILSYSPYDKTKGAHPRVVEIELLEKLASTYFKTVEVRSLGKFSHSKLNKSNLHLDAEESAEVVIICKN